jgi:hypothetical protein
MALTNRDGSDYLMLAIGLERCCLTSWGTPISVLKRVTVLYQIDKQGYGADDRNQSEQHPPTIAIGIMESPYRSGYGWNQNGYVIDAPTQTYTGFCAKIAGLAVNKRKNKINDDVEQDKAPVFLEAGSSPKHRVIFEDFYIPAHTGLLFFTNNREIFGRRCNVL